jgi:hypothetical protein
MSDKELELQEIESVKAQLDLLQVKYHHNAKLETLQNLLKEELAKKEEETPKAKSVDTGALRRSVREDVLKPVLVKVTCVNPHKSSWRGEKIYFGNSVVGRCVDFVPYNNGDEAEPIWLPKMLVNVLKDRRYLATTALKRQEVGIDGIGHRTAWKPEFVIETIKEG